MINLRAAVVLCIAGITACSFAPRYRAPPASAAVPDNFSEWGSWTAARPQDAGSRGKWWIVFQDSTLNELESQVTGANQNIRAAVARLDQARAETRIQRAGLFPALNIGSSATRDRASPNSPTFPRGINPTYGNFDLEADFSYEIDVWGRVRNSLNSAKAQQQASAADMATLDLSLHAELANDFFNLRGDDAQQDVLDRTVEAYSRSLEVTAALYKGGGAALADVAEARAQLDSARTQATDTHLQRTVTEHAIAVLLGRNPSSFHLDSRPLQLTASPPVVDPGLPSTLIQRRPDVAAAERRVASANFAIGVARAAYFPQFSLLASFGYDSSRSSNWLTAPSRTWSAGPSGVLTVFDAGRHRAEADRTRAAFDEEVANYRNTVLLAYQEVEDSLAALRRLQDESMSQASAVSATAEALQQSQYRYKAGLVTYLEVSTNETKNLQAQLVQISIQERRMGASILLIKALGGGWSQGHDIESPQAQM
jgi:NodT family efflux transporter outer membrane factor (OMF) lipoprotein